MQRDRGFKLGRRLVRVWPWVFRRRPKHYLRLDRATDCHSRSNLSKTSMMTTKLFDWGRHFARRLGRGSGGGGGTGWCCRIGAGERLLEGEGENGRPPKGHLAVYVGGEKEGGPARRYMVPVIYFNHPLFGELLREAEEEFGFHHPGGITIPCPAAKFELVRTRIAATGERLRRRTATSPRS